MQGSTHLHSRYRTYVHTCSTRGTLPDSTSGTYQIGTLLPFGTMIATDRSTRLVVPYHFGVDTSIRTYTYGHVMVARMAIAMAIAHKTHTQAHSWNIQGSGLPAASSRRASKSGAFALRMACCVAAQDTGSRSGAYRSVADSAKTHALSSCHTRSTGTLMPSNLNSLFCCCCCHRRRRRRGHRSR
jgi:hypothetical protein